MFEKILLLLKQGGFKVNNLQYDEETNEGTFDYNNHLHKFIIVNKIPLKISIPKGIKTGKNTVISIEDVIYQRLD